MVKRILLGLWQLPQNLLGLLFVVILKKNIYEIRNYPEAGVFLVSGSFTGISLGRYVLLNMNSYQLEKTIKHELGHSKQSKYLGWFYLLVVGLPSITMNIMTRWKWLKPEKYYKRWPESWADNLGGVER